MLTSEQQATLKAAVLADQTLAALYNDGDLGRLAEALSAVAVPAFVVWRSEYTPDQKAKAIDAGITQLDSLTASKRDSLLWWASRSHDASLSTTQAAINDLCGSQNTLKGALMDGAKRSATVIEKVFATGTGTTASPAVCSYIGGIGWSELIGL